VAGPQEIGGIGFSLGQPGEGGGQHGEFGGCQLGGEMGLQGFGGAAHLGQRQGAAFGQHDVDLPPVAAGGDAGDQALALQPAEQARHRRAGDADIGGKVRGGGDPLVADPAQHRRAEPCQPGRQCRFVPGLHQPREARDPKPESVVQPVAGHGVTFPCAQIGKSD